MKRQVILVWHKMSGITKRKKGQMLNSTERQLILNLMKYLKSKNSEKSTSEIIREISSATGCSERTIYKIKKEASKGIMVSASRTRMRRKENKNSRNVKYDSFVKSSIRKKIHNYFLQNNSPTLNTILCLVNSDPDLPNFKRSTLHTLLKEIGFLYEQRGKKSLLTESRDLVEIRHEFLRDIRKFRGENRWIVYLGETVISLVNEKFEKSESSSDFNNRIEPEKFENFQMACKTINTVVINASEMINGTTTLVYSVDATTLGNLITFDSPQQTNKGIQTIQDNFSGARNCPIQEVISNINARKDSSSSSEVKTDSNKHGCKSSREIRLLVLHAGSDQGFIADADSITLSKKKAEDVEIYKHWFLEKLLPKIPPNAVIVADNNAPYHEIEENFPDSSWKKQQIKNWLLSKNIKVDDLSQKKQLLSMVNQLRPMYSINFKINKMAKERGIIIVSLPPFHYELNPLNLVWAQIKYCVSSNMKAFKVKKIKHLIRKGFYSISQHNWMNYIHHVREVEDMLWTIDEQQKQHHEISIIQHL